MVSAFDSFHIPPPRPALLPRIKQQLALPPAYVEDLSGNQNSWDKYLRPQCVGLSTYIFWLRYATRLPGKPNQLFPSLFSLHCPVEFSLSAVLVF